MTEYGPYFDPEEQFDEIDPDDFYWDHHGVLLVRDEQHDGLEEHDYVYRDMDWDRYVGPEPQPHIVDVDVADAIEDPVAVVEKYNLGNRGLDTPSMKAKMRIASALTRTETIELDKPYF